MIKLALAILLFLISLLTVLKAPAYYFWLLAILVDEFPWLPVILTTLTLLIGMRSPSYPLVSNVLLGGALLLFLSPIFRAIIVSSSLPEALNIAFGSHLEKSRETPFRLTHMFSKNQELPCISVPYKQHKGKDLTLDFYPSRIAGKRPCVLVVHGGSWKSGDNKQLPELNSLLSARGYPVAAINYRLAPGAQSPAQVADVKDAIAFLKKKSVEWNIDTSQFVLLGRSAGAQIALLAAYTLQNPDIKGVIDFYGPADMVWGYSIPSNPLIMDSRKVMEDYLGGTYQAHPEKFEKSSPLLYVSKKSPPTLLIHGKNDVLVAYEHSRRLNLKLQENGVKHYFLTLPWATHGFDYNINGPGGQLSTYAVMHFLKCVTH
jgi:acetyl esterase/lipase